MSKDIQNIEQINFAMKNQKTVFFHYSSPNSTDDTRLEVLPLALMPVDGGTFQVLAIRILNGNFVMRRYNVKNIFDAVEVNDTPAYVQNDWKDAYLQKDKFFANDVSRATSFMTWWDEPKQQDEEGFNAFFVTLNGTDTPILLLDVQDGDKTIVTCEDKVLTISELNDLIFNMNVFTVLKNESVVNSVEFVEGSPVRFSHKLGESWKSLEPVVNNVDLESGVIRLMFINKGCINYIVLPISMASQWLHVPIWGNVNGVVKNITSPSKAPVVKSNKHDSRWD